MWGKLSARWKTPPSGVDNERGLAMVEYAPILALIAVVVMFTLPTLGNWVNDELGVGGLAVHYGDYVAGECPAGNWTLTHVSEAPPKNGPDPNQNGDNYVCVKSDTGNGNGNTGQNANNKDNNSDPVDNAG